MKTDDSSPDARFLGKSVVVLSDRYPPNAIGGAEVSLHYALLEAPSWFRRLLLVVTFDDNATALEHYTIDGVDVLRVPNAAPWPVNFTSVSKQRALRKRRIGARLAGQLSFISRIFTGRDLLQVFCGLLLRFFANPKGGVQTDHLIDKNDYRYRALSFVLSNMKCELVVADNTRSITLASMLDASIPKVAVVRDNRFSCARHNQAMMVGAIYCDKCTFSCVPEDARKHAIQRWMHGSMLRRVANRRQAGLRRFQTVVVTSHFLARGVGKVVGEGSRIVRIANAPGRSTQTEMKLSDSESAFEDLLMIGMMNEAKGQLEFVKNARDWIKSEPRRRIVLAGKGDRIKAAIRNFAASINLSEQIVLLDYIADRRLLFQQIRSAKLVILPTRWKEPFGRVPLEAGLAGKAVVAFAVGGLCETIVHEKTGLLVPPGDYRSFLKACDRLLNDDELRHELGNNARIHVEAHYSDEKTTQRFIETIISSFNNTQKH